MRSKDCHFKIIFLMTDVQDKWSF